MAKKASAKRVRKTKNVTPKVEKKAEQPLDPRRIALVSVAGVDVDALKDAGYLYADEVVATNADVLEGKVKGWDRAIASRAKQVCYEVCFPQGAPPPGSYSNDGN